jgi:hypothetical protein
MHRLSNAARIIGLLSLAVALTACSAIKLGYNTLPQMAGWWLDGYLDLNDNQEQRIREDLARLQQWHRREELPRLADLLQRAETMVGGEFTAQEACAFVPELRARLLAVAERAEPAAVTLALGLSAEQLAHLERKYRENNREYRKDWVDRPAGELREKRFKQFVDRAEQIYGRLDGPQREMLRSQAERSVFNAATNLQERQRRQQDILQGLRKIAGQPVSLSDARSVVHGLLERGLQSPDQRYRGYQEALFREACSNIAAIHQSTTPQQRQSAVRRLGAYQRDLEELAAQP